MDKPKRTLSEISHLFLTEIRERQGGSAPRPIRIGPKRLPDVSIDMTPEEYAAAFEDQPKQNEQTGAVMHVAVALASHLAEGPSHRVHQYARHLANQEGRVGVIEVDETELTITCFDRDSSEPFATAIADELDGRKISEVIAELAFDVTRWIISLPDPKSPEAREILRHAPHWVLMTTADHDGIVATYRALKGFAEIGHPRLSLVTLDVRNEAEAEAVYRKIDGVSRQFLNCPMEPQPLVQAAPNVVEHMVLHCKSTGEKTQSAPAPQWPILMEFLNGATGLDSPEQSSHAATSQPKPQSPAPQPGNIETYPMNISSPENEVSQPDNESDCTQVIDLPSGAADHSSILHAVVHQGAMGGQWVECPIKAPACPEAILAVSRDHRLTLLAIAGRGLTELRAIGLAFRWMTENRALIRMALPQLSIDVNAPAMIKLLVDHSDLTADLLQPLLQSSTVSVQAYRKLKWGVKTGLLLEAA